MKDELKQKVLTLINSRSAARIPEAKFSFSATLNQFIDYYFTEKQAEQHWEKISKRHFELEQKLDKKVSLYLAIVDYFTNDNQFFQSPVLVEINVLREAEEAAMLDPLTGAFNRRYMDIYLRKELNRCNRYEKNLSIMLLDIDDFKKINDTYGHVIGDTILAEISAIFKSTIRTEDVFCRYGGEEFLIIMPETKAEQSLNLFERIQKKLLTSELYANFGVTVSAGTAMYTPNKDDLANLIRYADISLYKAKANGKNQIVKFEKKYA
ncbi:GGDEF domain-containing protein [Treponema pectinovorum]|uniref:GGDEF domain-containing protein n=1 Tax=Treponema pectinovorum TaxID=164 RepID=UPI0011C81509|nr:GGDEF domain-containing protein [Treponema pectinovorum]